MSNRVQLCVVATLSANTPSDPEDEGVEGSYLIEVDADLGFPQRASAALDIFHEHIGIGFLDDFRFAVYSPEDGSEVEQDPNHDSYSLSGAGDFLGQVDWVPPVATSSQMG